MDKSASENIPPPSPDDISLALDSQDDFAFEMSVRAILNRYGGQVTHGWTYVDPTLEKIRQFDLRCRLSHPTLPRILRLALECKNLREDRPLIISETPRSDAESFHDYLVADRSVGLRQRTMRCKGTISRYKPRENVGKSVSRFQYDKRERRYGKISDDEIYDKWTQSLASSVDLCREAVMDGRDGVETSTFVLPILVVPDGTLWHVRYAEDGDRQGSPSKIDSSTLFVNHPVTVVPRNLWTNLSHVEVYTARGLQYLLARLGATDAKWDEYFPPGAVRHQPPISS